MNFTPSSAYRGYLAMITKVLELPTTLFLPDEKSGEKRETQICYRMRIQGKSISLEGFALRQQNNDNMTLTEVHAEEAFTSNRHFWIGSPQHLYKDYDLIKDKKSGKLSWAAAYDRDIFNEVFFVDLNDSIVTLSFSVAFLERINAEPVIVNKPGLASIVAAGATGASTAGHTLNDGPHDIPPAGAKVSFGDTATPQL